LILSDSHKWDSAHASVARYWQAWVYLAIFMGASVLTSLYLIENDPELLRRRMSGGPTAGKETTQEIIMLFTSIGFIALLVVSSLDYRFGWSVVGNGSAWTTKIEFPVF
jgi:hypothetical protein